MSEIHGWTHAPNGPDSVEASYEIKVFPDAGSVAPTLATVTTGDGKFVFVVPRDVAGCYLREAEAFVSTAGAVTVQIRNVTQAVDMLSTAITIDGGEYSSYTAGARPVINVSASRVQLGDQLAIDVDAVSGTPKGLGVILNFGPRLSV